MNYFLILLILLGLESSIPKGYYTIFGYAVFGNNEILRSQWIIVNEKDTILTDSMGFYKYDQYWEGVSFTKQLNQHYSFQNPKTIKFRYKKCYVVEIKNEWRKYGLKKQRRSKLPVKHHNIHFQKNCHGKWIK